MSWCLSIFLAVLELDPLLTLPLLLLLVLLPESLDDLSSCCALFPRGISGLGRSTMDPADSEDHESRNLRVGELSNTSNWSAMY